MLSIVQVFPLFSHLFNFSTCCTCLCRWCIKCHSRFWFSSFLCFSMGCGLIKIFCIAEDQGFHIRDCSLGIEALSSGKPSKGASPSDVGFWLQRFVHSVPDAFSSALSFFDSLTSKHDNFSLFPRLYLFVLLSSRGLTYLFPATLVKVIVMWWFTCYFLMWHLYVLTKICNGK